MATGELLKVVLTVIEIMKSGRGFQRSYYRVIVRCKNGSIESREFMGQNRGVTKDNKRTMKKGTNHF